MNRVGSWTGWELNRVGNWLDMMGTKQDGELDGQMMDRVSTKQGGELDWLESGQGEN